MRILEDGHCIAAATRNQGYHDTDCNEGPEKAIDCWKEGDVEKEVS